MKKRLARSRRVHEVDSDEILPEYDFSRARRNPYAARFSTNLDRELAMKKRPAKAKKVRNAGDEIDPEYDDKARRNPYSDRRREGTNLILLDPDVAKVFPDSVSVNKALRALSGIIRRSSKPPRTAR